MVAALRCLQLVLPLGLFGLARGACSGGRGTPFDDAADAVCRMNEMIDSYVDTLERRYADINSDEGVDESGNEYAGLSSACVGENYPGQISCSPNDSWDDWEYNVQFTNPNTLSCTRFDKDANNNFLSEPKTGRYTSCKNRNQCQEDADDECNEAPYFELSIDGPSDERDGSDQCRCNYQTVFEDRRREWYAHADFERKFNYLSRTGCTDDTNGDKCFVNIEKFGISLPEGTDISNRRVSSEVCGTNSLARDFEDFSEDNPDSNWHFMGFQQSGMYRIWPSVYECRTENQCSGCSDPRFRGWYADAASGPKAVVMVLDDSGSMLNKNRVNKLKAAASWVLNTLGQSDYASIVKFSSNVYTASEDNGGKLFQMTAANRARLKDYIAGNFIAQGGTAMDLGLHEAFNILEDSIRSGDSAGCEKIIIFLTDGVNTGAESPLAVINNRNDLDINARVFTYAFGDDAETEEMKEIACQHRGVFNQILDTDGDNLKQIMASYFVVLAAGVSQSGVRWVQWYEDGEGLGQQGGPCRAVYDRLKQEETGVPVLFGVICVGVHHDTFMALDGADTEWSALESDAKQCADTTFLTDANMELIRATINPQAVCDPGSGSGGAAGDAEDEDGSSLAPIIGGVAAGAVLLCGIAMFCKISGSGGSGKGKVEAAQPAPTPQPQQQAAPVGQVVAVY